MNEHYFDDETLMAFADGELDAATSQRIEQALETDEALAERLAVFLDSRIALAAELKPLIDEAVPEALAASVRRMTGDSQRHPDGDPVVSSLPEGVVRFHPKQAPAARPVARPWLMPVAASILAISAGLGGFLAGREYPARAPSLDAAIAAVLDREPSGSDVALEAGGGRLHIVSSFLDGRGEFCREYELRQPQQTVATIACRQDGAWTQRLALSSPRIDGYAPASAQETIDSYLATIEAAAPLTVEEEKEALAGTGG